MRNLGAFLLVAVAAGGCVAQSNRSASNEELDQNDASRAVHTRLDQCIRSAGEPGGRYVAELHILQDGTISKVDVRTPSLVGDSRLSTCLARRLENTKFPKSTQPEQMLRFETNYHVVHY